MNIRQAVALLYPETKDAPVIVAKQRGELAEKMISLAQKYNVPVFEESDTVNILSLYEVGECIPEETYEVISKIFAFIRRTVK